MAYDISGATCDVAVPKAERPAKAADRPIVERPTVPEIAGKQLRARLRMQNTVRGHHQYRSNFCGCCSVDSDDVFALVL